MLKWCQGKGFALSPIGEEPFKISRYRAPKLQAELLEASAGLSSEQRNGTAKYYNDAATHVVVHGLRYKQPNGQGVISAAYDRDGGVGFFAVTNP